MSHDIDPSLSLADILKPVDQQDDFTAWMLNKEVNPGAYIGAKKLPDGTYAGVMKLMFTEAICLGVTRDCPAEKRYCYSPGNFADMLIAFHKLKSFDDEPAGWISARPKPFPQDCRPIETAPKDGSYIRAFNFDQFDCIQWGRTAAFQNGWVEVDSTRDGEPLDPTHWLPYV
jgi:hypothetical protein